jgi:hypothetical protein
MQLNNDITPKPIKTAAANGHVDVREGCGCIYYTPSEDA